MKNQSITVSAKWQIQLKTLNGFSVTLHFCSKNLNPSTHTRRVPKKSGFAFPKKEILKKCDNLTFSKRNFRYGLFLEIHNV